MLHSLGNECFKGMKSVDLLRQPPFSSGNHRYDKHCLRHLMAILGQICACQRLFKAHMPMSYRQVQRLDGCLDLRSCSLHHYI